MTDEETFLFIYSLVDQMDMIVINTFTITCILFSYYWFIKTILNDEDDYLYLDNDY